MTAKELFEELGYCKELGMKYHIDYCQGEDTNCFKYITFDLRHRTVSCDENFKSMEVDMPTFKAIQKQLEELGWLENE